jgi:2-iminobutanoate/2-iminopropanoate deaminase
VTKEVICTKNAPATVGPYSHAIKGGDLLFVSGQLPIDVSTGRFVGDGIGEQTRQCLKNVKTILEAAGSCLEKVLKTTVFLKDMNDFEEMNKIYSQFFKDDFPARCCVEVARLPQDAKVEIEAIAGLF